MSDDLKLIKQLETEIGIKLPRIALEQIGRQDITGFDADDKGRGKYWPVPKRRSNPVWRAGARTADSRKLIYGKPFRITTHPETTTLSYVRKTNYVVLQY
ncbi:MAG: hypothetical protein GY765_27820 [bacterium]|nr:hypothetical protein [bacterium]